jgi:quercetin dioxygenase-like cupin family protein
VAGATTSRSAISSLESPAATSAHDLAFSVREQFEGWHRDGAALSAHRELRNEAFRPARGQQRIAGGHHAPCVDELGRLGALDEEPARPDAQRLEHVLVDVEVLVVDLELSADGRVPGAHVHPLQEERFEVMQGTLKFRKGMKTVTARPGDKVIVPSGTVHRFWNAGEATARVRVEVRPALRMEELFETAVSLAQDGRTLSSGMPDPLELALFMHEFEAEVRAPFAPAPLVRMVMTPLTWLARRRGLDSRYQKLTGRAPQSRRDSRRPSNRSPHSNIGKPSRSED